jgi:hypothetical protein
MGLSTATQEAMWLRRLMVDFGESSFGPNIIYQDNQGTMAMAKNPGQYARTKQIARYSVSLYSFLPWPSLFLDRGTPGQNLRGLN